MPLHTGQVRKFDDLEFKWDSWYPSIEGATLRKNFLQTRFNQRVRIDPQMDGGRQVWEVWTRTPIEGVDSQASIIHQIPRTRTIEGKMWLYDSAFPMLDNGQPPSTATARDKQLTEYGFYTRMLKDEERGGLNYVIWKRKPDEDEKGLTYKTRPGENEAQLKDVEARRESTKAAGGELTYKDPDAIAEHEIEVDQAMAEAKARLKSQDMWGNYPQKDRPKSVTERRFDTLIKDQGPLPRRKRPLPFTERHSSDTREEQEREGDEQISGD